jgi:hypothetical protein
VDNSLDAFVHASLMLKKLIKEWEAQREGAREALAGLSLPFMDDSVRLLEETRTQQGVGGTVIIN